MSTIDSGHCEALYEQAEEAGDLRAGDDTWDAGGASCAALCGQCEPYLKWLKDPRFAREAEMPEQEATFLPVVIEVDIDREPAPIAF